jgi:hypothetical protein
MRVTSVLLKVKQWQLFRIYKVESRQLTIYPDMDCGEQDALAEIHDADVG